MNTAFVTPSRIFGVFCVFIFAGVEFAAHAQSDWFPIGGEVSSVRYDTISYDGSQFLAAGDGRRYSISDDGINWETEVLTVPEVLSFGITQVVGSKKGWHAIYQVNSGGNYVFAGNPSNWTITGSSTIPSYRDATYGDDVQVILRSSRRSILRIPDGSGSVSFLDLPLPGRYNSIAFGDGVFVLCGDDGRILTSTNGSSWTSRSSGTSTNLSRVKFGQNEFFCVGEDGVLLRSDNGLAWEAIISDAGIYFYDVALYRNYYYVVALDPSPIFRSDRRGNLEDLGLRGAEISAIAASKNRIVVCGNRGLLAHSPDGEHWFNLDTQNGSETDEYAFIAEKGVVARHPIRGLEFSRDFKRWYASYSGEEFSRPFAHANTFYRYNFIDSGFYRSEDGLDWSLASEIPPLEGNLTDFSSVNGRLFAFDNGDLVGVLENAQQWTIPAESIRGNPIGLRFEDGLYILPTNIESVDFESVDGLSWSPRSPPGSQSFSSTYVEFQNAFYSTSSSGVIRSTDGNSWEPVDQALFDQYPDSYRDFFIVEGILYLSNYDGHIFSSPDGLNWSGQRVVVESSSSISEILEFNGDILAIAENGQIYSQSRIQKPTSAIETIQDSPTEFTFAATLSDTERLIAARESGFRFDRFGKRVFSFQQEKLIQ